MRTSFALVLAYLVIVRAVEVAYSRRNTDALLRRGARQIEPDGLRGIVLVHALWFVGLLVEETWIGPTLAPGLLRSAAVGVAVLSEVMRLVAIRSLGDRWSMRVIVLPGVPPVRHGLFRVMRHPGYLAVLIQLVALPLALGLTWTACAILPLKLAALGVRVKIEQRALAGAAEVA